MNNRKENMRSPIIILGSFLLGIILVIGIVKLMANNEKASDEFVRDHTVLLFTTKGSCTGFELQTKSHRVYTLTARHCSNLLINGRLLFRTQFGGIGEIKMIAVDPHADIMLLEGLKVTGLLLADTIRMHESIHAIGYGLGVPFAYKMTGEIVLRNIDDNTYPCELALCGDGTKGLALMTLSVLPGTSGSPILNENNQIVGIVAALNTTYNTFSYAVRLDDIKFFLQGR